MSHCCTDLSGAQQARYIRQFCFDRIEKYGLHTLKSGACKSCPYRYRGEKKDMIVCMFGNIPKDWHDIESEYDHE